MRCADLAMAAMSYHPRYRRGGIARAYWDFVSEWQTDKGELHRLGGQWYLLELASRFPFPSIREILRKSFLWAVARQKRDGSFDTLYPPGSACQVVLAYGRHDMLESLLAELRHDPLPLIRDFESPLGMKARKEALGEDDPVLARRLRDERLGQQREDGSWQGLILATAQAIHDLLDCGVSSTAEPIHRACTWLRAQQRPVDREVFPEAPDIPWVGTFYTDDVEQEIAFERERHPEYRWRKPHVACMQILPTTEFAVRRGLELGLDRDDQVFVKAIGYMVDVLEDRVRWSDGYEKDPCFPIAVKLFTAAKLSEIDPSHPALDSLWDLWYAIFRRTFAGGTYNQAAERAASEELLGVNINHSYVAFHSAPNLRFMGSRSDRIPEHLQEALLTPLWNGQIGLGYLRSHPSRFPPATTHRDFYGWLQSMDVLSSFPVWKKIAKEGIEWLWSQRSGNGLWDGHPQRGRQPYFPLSESWRKRGNRRIDCSTRVLILLRKWFV